MRQSLLPFLALLLWVFTTSALSIHRHSLHKSKSFHLCASSSSPLSNENNSLDWIGSSLKKISVAAILASSLSLGTLSPAHARPEGVNRPDLLPSEKGVALIDVANFLSKGQEKKAIASISELEKRTGLKLRVLCQRYCIYVCILLYSVYFVFT
jgi:hypothetical protein